MGIDLKGFEDISTMLSDVAPKAAKSMMVKAAKPAAEVVIAAMADTVPVGVGILEEQLVYKNKWSSDVGGEVLNTNIGPTKSAFWGMFQEFGTSKMEGKHWMARAWEGCKDEVLEVYAQGFRELNQTEAALEDDANDRELGRTSAKKLQRDRNAAYRENKKRNG